MPDTKSQEPQARSEEPTRLPPPHLRERPADLDVEEGRERMQGEPRGRQEPRQAPAKPDAPQQG